VSHVLNPIVVFDPEGRAVRLGALWADRTAVLVFVRHFGCIFCRQQVAEMVALLDQIRSSGAELYVIGNGTIEDARTFRDEQTAAVSILTDPNRQTYRALQMRSGLASILAPGVLWRSLKARRAGFHQSRVAGAPFQQGGVLVIAPGGVEHFRFISREAGDHPTPASILAALDAKR
jgi:AhpC/TSA antioxidant enzyme